MMAFMVSEAVALFELDAIALDTIDRTDMHAVGAYHFHAFPDLVRHSGFSFGDMLAGWFKTGPAHLRPLPAAFPIERRSSLPLDIFALDCGQSRAVGKPERFTVTSCETPLLSFAEQQACQARQPTKSMAWMDAFAGGRTSCRIPGRQNVLHRFSSKETDREGGGVMSVPPGRRKPDVSLGSVDSWVPGYVECWSATFIRVIPGPRSGTRNPERRPCSFRLELATLLLWIPGSAARPRNDGRV
jgi:hypothetical protein